MRTVDHKKLAGLLAAEMKGNAPAIYIKAFVFGNIEPDCNRLTYLHGWFCGTKLHGHNYENILPVMKKLYCQLQGKNHFGLMEYYRLGKLMHYVADAFTFPHNQAFEGTLAAHCTYERKLHKSFESMLSDSTGMFLPEAMNCDFNNIQELHDEYMREAGAGETDLKYIMQATMQIFETEYRRACDRVMIQAKRLAGYL